MESGKLTCVMVEDEDTVFGSISSAVRAQVQEVGDLVRATTVDEYLELHKSRGFDIVILDLRLKNARGAVEADSRGGLEISKNLAVWHPGALVIVYSAYIDVPQTVLAMRNGAWDCIFKEPNSRKALIDSIKLGLREQAFNDAWFERNEVTLRDTYAGKYVGVLNGQVVDSDVDEPSLMDRMLRKHGESACQCYFVTDLH